MKTAKLIKYLTLLLFLTLLSNCSNENEQGIIIEEKTENSDSFISLNKFKSTQTYIDLQAYQDNHTRIAAKGSENSVNYSVTGDDVLTSSLQNGVTYSVPITSSNELENQKYLQRLFVEETLNGEVSVYIVQISIENDEFKIIPIKISEKSIINDIDSYGRRNCVTVIYQDKDKPCSCTEKAEDEKDKHYPGDLCVCKRKARSGGLISKYICYEIPSDTDPSPIVDFTNISNNINPLYSIGGGNASEIYIGSSSEFKRYKECLKTGMNCYNLPKLSSYQTGKSLEDEIKKEKIEKFTSLFLLDPNMFDWVNLHQSSEFVNKTIQFCEDNDWSREVTKNAVGQIELEMLTDPTKRKWKAKKGHLSNRPNLTYTHVDTDFNTTYFKMTDGSIVVASGEPLKITSKGLETFKDNISVDFGKYYYIKLPGDQWAEMLYASKSTADDLANLFKLGGIELGKNLGRYVLPVEDIKILIDGKDFDGQQVSRWKAAGFLLLTVVPGSKSLKVLKVIDKVSDATAFAIKLGSNTLVVNTAKAGLKVVRQNNVIKFLSKTGDEIARIANNILTFNYKGFGGKIITTPNKTTTVIGKWKNGTDGIINSGLSKSGKNTGGINALSEIPNPKWNDQQIWENINEPWLKKAASRKDVIRAVSDPLKPSNVFKNLTNVPNSVFNNPNSLANYLKNLSDPNMLKNISFYGREIKWLFENGYIFNPSNFKFIK